MIPVAFVRENRDGPKQDMSNAPLIRLAKRPSRHNLSPIFRLLSIKREKHSGQRRIAPLQNKPTTMTTPQPNYTNWSPSDLIAHIHKLESQLQQNGTSTTTTDPTRPPPFKKPRKAPKPFDASRYNTRLIALRFAYLGGAYNGFEHHTGNKTPLPTIEEELWKALRKTKLIFPTFKEGKEEEICWDGVDYSKCGRTDRGVSAFGQVIGVRVRSARGVKAKPKKKVEDKEGGNGDVAMADATTTAAATESREGESKETAEPEQEPEFDPIQDELPYIHLLNKVLPPDIRMLAWCPNPPEDFSARFNCKERRYRYFFTNPAFTPLPGSNSSTGGDGWLNIQAMQEAAKKYEGLHDFRNFCKIDPSKQITNFQRRIFHAGIHAVGPKEDPANLASQTGQLAGSSGENERGVATHGPQLYWFEVRGSAFLWHQVRHLIAVLFLVGQGHEDPSIVDRLLDVEENPSRPLYEMASDAPLVLWDCVFPDPEKLGQADHATDGEHTGYEDGLNWIHIGDGRGGQDKSKRNTVGVEDGKYGRSGLMEDLWALWRRRKMDEILAGSLMNVVGQQGKAVTFPLPEPSVKCDRVYDGSELPRSVGTYIPVMKRARTEEPDVVNARYAAKKGIPYPRVVVDDKGDDDDE
jgi:tRNA pseudouridine38/39 synthase